MNKFFFIDPCIISRIYPNDTPNDLDQNIWSEYVIDLDSWPLDNFAQDVRVYFVDEILYSILSRYQITGIQFKKIKVITSSGNFEVYPKDVVLPSFREMLVTGIANKDDFGIYSLPNNYPFLVVSYKALKILLNKNCNNIQGEQIPDNIDLEAYFKSIFVKIQNGDDFPYLHESMFFKNK